MTSPRRQAYYVFSSDRLPVKGQRRTIFWLRWRLTKNQWSRRGVFDDAAGLLLGILLGVAALASCAAGLFLGMRVFAWFTPHALMLGWDAVAGAFLFFWLIGMIVEIQRAESLDLTKFMHLPVSLKSIYLFNYLASWGTPAIIIALPGSLCLAAGLALAAGPRMLAIVPAILGFFCMVTAGTYLLRGWLVALMVNQRRRQTILLAASLLLIVFTQLPNLYVQFLKRSTAGIVSAGHPGPDWFSAAHLYLPPLWLGASAQSLASGSLAPGLFATVGSFALGGIALVAGYRGTLRFYREGKDLSEPSPSRRAKPGRQGKFLEICIPFLPNEVGAIALATFRSHLRAPEIKMTLFGQVAMNLTFGVLFMQPNFTILLARFQPITGSMIVMLSLLGAIQLFCNQFGFDRDGFRAFVLAPVSRRNLLLGKNLAALPIIALVGIFILSVALLAGLIGFSVFVASLWTFFGGFLVFAILGNWLSIVAPYRMAQGSLRPTKVPPKVTLIIILGMLLSPVAAGLIFLPATLELSFRPTAWPQDLMLHVSSFVFLLAATGLYFATIPPLGRLLREREHRVLYSVTQEIE